MPKPLLCLFLGLACVQGGSAVAKAPEKFSWCAVSLIGKEARISSIFLAEEARGSDVLADRLRDLTGTRPSRQFLCKQFAAEQDARNGLADTVRAMKAAGYDTVQLELTTGAVSAL